MDISFDEVKKQCSEFAWNLLSSIQLNRAIEKIDLENEEHKTLFENMIETHCKYIQNEAIH